MRHFFFSFGLVPATLKCENDSFSRKGVLFRDKDLICAKRSSFIVNMTNDDIFLNGMVANALDNIIFLFVNDFFHENKGLKSYFARFPRDLRTVFQLKITISLIKKSYLKYFLIL